MFDFESQLAFYTSYHRNRINVSLHIVCVPAILWTVLVFISLLRPIFPVLGSNAMILSFAYLFYYVILDPLTGLIYMPFLITLAHSAQVYARSRPFALYTALAVHIVGWTAQFVGHGYFEKRRPALLDNLVEALVIAPLFAFIDLLFMVGYKPSLKARVDRRAKTMASIQKKK